jgi:hypothetical protein
MPKSVTGASYDAMRVKLVMAADAANGRFEDEDAEGPLIVPRLSNAHAVAIWQALRRAGARAPAPIVLAGERWSLEWFAYGWESLGDRFVVTREQAAKPYPEDALVLFWDFVRELCTNLDAQHTVVRALPLDYSFAAFEQGARDGWEAMKVFQANLKVPTVPGREPVEVNPPTVNPPTDSGAGWGWLLILLALAAASGGR